MLNILNSMTILRGHDNIWNEDYHVVHHHETYVHWSEMPQSFVPSSNPTVLSFALNGANEVASRPSTSTVMWVH